ncbi:Outer membrane protein assembly factor BamB, contains PQQ-like beta-propeller repeat [Halogranum rubrum]|uniref:Outer membrane protein assembly factor BamB, contains PQQ-like beta-propeller repeat n=1 Tax=Halogranum rubrum TaxID=553466 RepID=A0A1I4EZY1_9EURY|nr:PQQ-binding-like beta-propeller repeat protein [Halogranum rubrum]SFL10763.1 Outer membrane protein assembly factor BamB, contains PQQ-like beta-propeller repeat [Halogranum rubrum]
MRIATVVVGALLVVGLLGVAVVGLGDSGGELTERWVSDTGRNVQSNHHAVAVGDGRVYAPVSAESKSDGCALVALSADDGTTVWDYQIPTENCIIHSVADPTIADYDDDGVNEVLAATTENEVAAFDPDSGEKEFNRTLSAYGYTQPVVADLTPASGRELVVVDASGVVFVLNSDGDALWTHDLDARVFAQPTVADYDDDGEPELFAAGDDGNATLFAANGSVEWQRQAGSSILWATSGDADDDAAYEAFVATSGGDVVAFDGREGHEEWRLDAGRYTAVHALEDTDEDGQRELYVTARDGTLRRVDAATGDVAWKIDLTAESVQMMPPPVVGDVDGDGASDIVAAGNDGTVSVVSPGGDVQATYSRDVPLFTHATLADTDGDGDDEILVMYADGRVVSLDYEA